MCGQWAHGDNVGGGEGPVTNYGETLFKKFLEK